MSQRGVATLQKYKKKLSHQKFFCFFCLSGIKNIVLIPIDMLGQSFLPKKVIKTAFPVYILKIAEVSFFHGTDR